MANALSTLAGFKDVSNSNVAPLFLKKNLGKFIFPSVQVYVVDGERLRDDPVEVMTQVQSFLRLKPVIDFSKKIKFVVIFFTLPRLFLALEIRLTTCVCSW